MPIKKQIDPTKDLTTIIFSGEISYREIIHAMTLYYEGVDGPPTKRVLWDYSRATAENLSVDELEDIAHIRINSKDKMIPGKTAVVAPMDIAFGMSRMFQAKTLGTQRYLMVFRSLEEANEWLEE